MNTDETNRRWAIQEKWGKAVTGGKEGFFAVPDVLIKNQAQIPVTTTEMNVVLNLLMHWWSADEMPFPRPAAIARRMGVSTRTVERAIKSLEHKELIERKDSEKSENGISIRRFDMRGIVRKLQSLS